MIRGFDKYLIFSMEKNVTGLMEESKPEMVIRFPSKTHLNNSLRGFEPASCAIDMGAGEFRDEYNGNAPFSTEFFHLRLKDFWGFSRKRTDFF